MSVKTDSLNGAYVLVDADKPWRLIDAFGDTVRKFLLGPGVPCDDTTGDPTNFVITVTEAGAGGDSTLVNGEASGYPLLATTDNAEYDGLNVQLKGEQFKLAAGKHVYIGAKVKLSEATQIDFLVGLCELKTDILNTGTSHGIASSDVEGVFFVKLDAVTAIKAKSYLDGAETFTAAAGTLTTGDHEYEIVWDGTVLKFYLDGTLITQIASGLPDGDLTPTFNVRAGSANARTCSIAYLKAISIG